MSNIWLYVGLDKYVELHYTSLEMRLSQAVTFKNKRPELILTLTNK